MFQVKGGVDVKIGWQGTGKGREAGINFVSCNQVVVEFWTEVLEPGDFVRHSPMMLPSAQTACSHTLMLPDESNWRKSGTAPARTTA